jgi:hypothetical protein
LCSSCLIAFVDRVHVNFMFIGVGIGGCFMCKGAAVVVYLLALHGKTAPGDMVVVAVQGAPSDGGLTFEDCGVV